MSSPDDEKIAFLHQSIQKEAAKMLKWKVDTSVQIKDKENRIQECQGIADDQKRQKEELQSINHELTAEKRKLNQDRDELCHRIEHIGREIDVLEHQHSSLLSKLSDLKANKIQAKQIDEIKNTELDQLVGKFTQLHIDYQRDIGILAKSQDQMRDKIKNTLDDDKKKQTEMIKSISEVSNNLNIVNDDLVNIGNKVNDYKLKIQIMTLEFNNVSNKVKEVIESQKNVQEINSSTERKLLNKIDSLKVEETSKINDNLLLKQDNEGYTKKMNNLEQELSSLAINSINFKENFSKECIELDKLVKEKEVLSNDLHNNLKELELLASKGDEIPILKNKKMALRNDLASCEESKKVFESELIALRKVEKSKLILEEENKEFSDNIGSLEGRLKELEGLVLKCSGHKSELAIEFEKLSVNYDEKLGKVEEGTAVINKHNNDINQLKILTTELQKKIMCNEEEIIRLDHDINQKKEILHLREQEINSASTESSSISKNITLYDEKLQKLESNLEICNQTNERKMMELNENKSEINRRTTEKDKLASSLGEKVDLISHRNANITDLKANIKEIEKKIDDTKIEKESKITLIDSLTLKLGEQKIQLQMKEEKINGYKLDLNNKLKENQQRIKQLEKEIKVSQTGINNGIKKEDQVLKQLEKKDKNLKDITSELVKSKTKLESVEHEFHEVTEQMTKIETELTDTSKKNDNTSQLIEDKIKDNEEKGNQLVRMKSEVKVKQEELKKLKQEQERKEKEQDMVLKEISLQNEKIVKQLKEDIIGLNQKLSDTNIEVENVKKLSNSNDSIKKCKAQEKLSYQVMDMQNQQKHDKDQHNLEMNKLCTEEQRLEIEIKRYKTKKLEFTGSVNPHINNLDEDELDSDEETNTARKVKPMQTPRNFANTLPVMNGPPRSEISHNKLQPPLRGSAKSYLKKPSTKKSKVDHEKSFNSAKTNPPLFDDIMVCSEES